MADVLIERVGRGGSQGGSLAGRWATCQGPEVSVVESEPDVRSLLELLLRRSGLTVRWAASGHEAVERFRERHPSIHVVPLGVQLPGRDGPATLATLRETAPIVACCFLSGDSGKYAPEELRGLGAAHLVRKPLTDCGFRAQALLNTAPGAWCHSG